MNKDDATQLYQYLIKLSEIAKMNAERATNENTKAWYLGQTDGYGRSADLLIKSWNIEQGETK